MSASGSLGRYHRGVRAQKTSASVPHYSNLKLEIGTRRIGYSANWKSDREPSTDGLLRPLHDHHGGRGGCPRVRARSAPPPPHLELAPLHAQAGAANQALGRLDGLTSLLPEPQIFIYLYVRKEAVVSSQIEGTQSSLSDLLMFELDEAPETCHCDDVVEVSSYVAAMEHGLSVCAAASALGPADPRGPRRPAATRPGCGQGAGRVPAQPELDRRLPAGKRLLRPAAG